MAAPKRSADWVFEPSSFADVQVDDRGARLATASRLVGDLLCADRQPGRHLPRQLGADDGRREDHLFRDVGRDRRDDRARLRRRSRRQGRHVELARAPLQLARRHAGADRAADHHRLLEHVAGAGREARLARVGDDLARLEDHLPAGAAHGHDLGRGFDEVPGEDRRQELDRLVGAKEPLVPVDADQQLRRQIPEETEHSRSVDQLARVVSLVGGHAQTEESLRSDHRNETSRWVLCDDPPNRGRSAGNHAA